ncbi:hypothetical protein [Mycobacteroides abscessus]|uniref:hypothetical protein n=1 Tax=Mycobacteroides abscessus TaxID=36809 RepID=UPI001F1FD69F|nr:hypothetical protein [Mycobacteroides abscessus]
MLVGLAGCLAWSFVVIPFMDTGKPLFYAVAMLGLQVVAAIALAPTATFIPELFATRYRYSGSALATNIASIAGGVAPPPDCRNAASNLWRLGGRSHVSRDCIGELGVHLPTTGNQRKRASISPRRCFRCALNWKPIGSTTSLARLGTVVPQPSNQTATLPLVNRTSAPQSRQRANWSPTESRRGHENRLLPGRADRI